MKILKVNIIKEFKNNMCYNKYPEGYNAEKTHVLAYSDEPLSDGLNDGWCVVLVNNNYPESENMIKINSDEVFLLIQQSLKNISDYELKEKVIINKMTYINERINNA
jgi:hypothetical protein